jgi:HAD superfamily hydrolase (TIGR01509 family)
MQIKAVIFDMDGLMLDTEPLYRAAAKKAAAEFGFTLTDSLHERLIGRNVEDAERIVREAFGPDFPLEAYKARNHALEAEFKAGPLPKKPGLDELLDLLDSWRIPKAVATSTRSAISLPELKRTGLFERFQAVATGDEVAKRKPAPDLFLLATKRLGVEPAECLVLEDAEPGVIGAHRAGMQVYMVPDLQAPSPAARENANAIFGSLFEVTARLRELRSADAKQRSHPKVLDTASSQPLE